MPVICPSCRAWSQKGTEMLALKPAGIATVPLPAAEEPFVGAVAAAGRVAASFMEEISGADAEVGKGSVAEESKDSGSMMNL